MLKLDYTDTARFALVSFEWNLFSKVVRANRTFSLKGCMCCFSNRALWRS